MSRDFIIIVVFGAVFASLFGAAAIVCGSTGRNGLAAYFTVATLGMFIASAMCAFTA